MHPHRSSALDYASAARDVQIRVYGACTAEAAASESSGLSMDGCTRGHWAVGRTPRSWRTRTNSRTDEFGVRTNNFSH